MNQTQVQTAVFYIEFIKNYLKPKDEVKRFITRINSS